MHSYFLTDFTHNFISIELDTKLGLHGFEMRGVVKADGAFKGKDVSITPLIGKLRICIQAYVDKEDSLISSLKHEDVIIGAPWFDCMATTMKFLERKVLFTYRGKDMSLDVNSASNTIPVVHTQDVDKVIKKSLSCYMVFVKVNSDDACVLKNASYETKEEIEMSNF